MEYPFNDIATEFESSRRASLGWLGALLAVGVGGALMLATQFTGPIRGLQNSFRRVESGDLEVHVEAPRQDEIGELTGSFNHMVERLRKTREMETRLSDAERLAAVGRLAAGVAHEVRNPLNAIQLGLQRMREKAPESASSADFQKSYELVSSEIIRLERLVSNFLDLSRSSDMHRVKLDACEVADRSAELFTAAAAEKGVQLRRSGDHRAMILGDGARLAQVWNNLYSNAIEASSAGSSIELSCSSTDGHLRAELRDEGHGLGAEEMSRIWEPFYSGRPDGNGLGLSIVRSIVEAHGGRVGVESEVGVGSVLIVDLPLADSDEAEQA